MESDVITDLGETPRKLVHTFSSFHFFAFLSSSTTFSSCFDPCDQLTSVRHSKMDLFWAAPPVSRYASSSFLILSFHLRVIQDLDSLDTRSVRFNAWRLDVYVLCRIRPELDFRFSAAYLSAGHAISTNRKEAGICLRRLFQYASHWLGLTSANFVAVYKYGSAVENSMAPGEFFIYLLFVAFNLMVSGRVFFFISLFALPHPLTITARPASKSS